MSEFLKTITKLWNASKFTLNHLDDFERDKNVKLTDLDKGILSKFNKLVKDCTSFFEEYEYSKSKLATDIFFWNTFCDNYLEIAKNRLYNPGIRGVENRRSAQYTLDVLLKGILKMFSPIMPYITEEIYSMYFINEEKVDSIHLSDWPKYESKLEDPVSEKIFDKFVEVLNEVRQVKSKKNKSLKEEIILNLQKKDKTLLLSSIEDLKAVTSSKEIRFGPKFKVEW